jgi:hypothetical protein
VNARWGLPGLELWEALLCVLWAAVALERIARHCLSLKTNISGALMELENMKNQAPFKCLILSSNFSVFCSVGLFFLKDMVK